MRKIFVYTLGHLIALTALVILLNILVGVFPNAMQPVLFWVSIAIPQYFLIRFSIIMIQRRRSR